MIGIRIKRTEGVRERYVRWRGGGEIRHRLRFQGAFNCRGPYGSREASVVHEKRYIFLTAEGLVSWPRGGGEADHQS